MNKEGIAITCLKCGSTDIKKCITKEGREEVVKLDPIGALGTNFYWIPPEYYYKCNNCGNTSDHILRNIEEVFIRDEGVI